MACNCKKVAEIEEKYGTEEDEGLFWKAYHFLWRVLFSVIIVVLGVLITPIIMFIVMFNLIFRRKNVLVLPKQLSKYLE